MTNIVDIAERDAFVLFLRSKTALGRLNDAEVHAVIAFLESIGFAHQAAPAPAPVVVAPAPAVMTPADQVAAQLAQVLPVVPTPAVDPAPVAAPPVSVLANLESIIKKDVEAFFAPGPIAPPPAQ